ncbi:MAG: hypothetical protein PV358_00300 [Acidimicrobiales bacterium]|nr:hypothetical protein [Acidimicrobiales bacterium]
MPGAGMSPLTTDATDEGAAQKGERTAAAARLPYLPGLDGLRAVALLAVLAFHHGFGWARGGSSASRASSRCPAS